MKKILYAISLFSIILSCITGSINAKEANNNNEFNAVQYFQANKLFQKDAKWRGSDDAYSIKLGKERILWLFGDTLVSSNKKIVSRTPKNIVMLRNTIGIQRGSNPETATMKYFYTSKNNASDTQAFFENPSIDKKNWLWPGDCTLLDDGKTLIVFFMNIMPTDTGLKFDIAGHEIAIVNNSHEEPNKWDIRWVEHLNQYSKLKILLGSGGVITEENHLYAYGFSSNKKIKGITLARWPLKLFKQDTPNLSNPEWWTNKMSWVQNNELKDIKPKVLWDKQQTEFTVTKLEEELYVMFQAYPLDGYIGNSDLVARVSTSLTGPWSEMFIVYSKLYREKSCPKDIMVYAGKYHPELVGSNYIFTYATNTQSMETLWNYQTIYYPSFLKMDETSFISKLRARLTRRDLK